MCYFRINYATLYLTNFEDEMNEMNPCDNMWQSIAANSSNLQMIEFYKVLINIVSFNDKSFNFSRGYLELTRKIKKLDIFFRYSPDNSMWNSTGSWKRIIPGIDKKTLISVCLISLKNSILHFLDDNQLDITINLIADKSNEIFDEKIVNILSSDKIKVIKSNSKINGNRGSYFK